MYVIPEQRNIFQTIKTREQFIISSAKWIFLSDKGTFFVGKGDIFVGQRDIGLTHKLWGISLEINEIYEIHDQ